jgi:hypothetical protein
MGPPFVAARRTPLQPWPPRKKILVLVTQPSTPASRGQCLASCSIENINCCALRGPDDSWWRGLTNHAAQETIGFIR